jgi:hypothetical protein
VEAEEGGHDRERRSEQNGPAVAAPGSDDGQRDRGEGRGQRGHSDPVEVDAAAEGDLVTAEEVPRSRREGRQRAAHDQDRGEPVARASPHELE